MWLSLSELENFITILPKDTLEISIHKACSQKGADNDKTFSEYAQLKRERGESLIHPAVAPVSLLSVLSALVSHARRLLGGQNLAALCTAAGQNLTAIGSSHSLTETVNLGTMTTAGLIGTLHEIHLLLITIMLDGQMAAATHSNVIL